MARRLTSLCLVVLLSPTSVLAHPHMFIQTEVAVLFNDQGDATGIKVTWIYDSFTSLQLLTDRGMDQNMDSKLTDQELAALNGFDMHWQPGYQGDSYARLDQQMLHMSGPRDWTLTYADDVISTTHIRDFDTPKNLVEHVLGVQTYDPTYYVLYDISPDVNLVNAPPNNRCRAIFHAADTAKAKKDLEDRLRAMQKDVEVNFPPVGKQFASEAWVICASGS